MQPDTCSSISNPGTVSRPDEPASAAPQAPPSPLAGVEPWDLVASGYAAEADRGLLPFSREAIRRAELRPDARVLDIAAGPGTLALEVAPRVARVDAIDFSPAMIEELRRKRAALGISNLSECVGDGQALPYADQSFDAAFSMFGLMFFPDRARGFAELLRVLAPGGLAVVSSWAPIERSPLMIAMFGALRAADPDRSVPAPNLLNLENPRVFEAELGNAGFESIRVEAFEHGIWFESAQSFWDGMTRGSAPLLLLKHRLGPAEWERQSQIAITYLSELIPSPRTLNTTAYLGMGRRRAG